MARPYTVVVAVTLYARDVADAADTVQGALRAIKTLDSVQIREVGHDPDPYYDEEN